jgi:hypothetical protein
MFLHIHIKLTFINQYCLDSLNQIHVKLLFCETSHTICFKCSNMRLTRATKQIHNKIVYIFDTVNK